MTSLFSLAGNLLIVGSLHDVAQTAPRLSKRDTTSQKRKLVRLAFFFAILVAVTLTGAWAGFAKYWLLPFFWERLLVPHNVNSHFEHQLCPSTPFYNRPALHRALMRNPDDASRAYITHGDSFGLVKACIAQATRPHASGTLINRMCGDARVESLNRWHAAYI